MRKALKWIKRIVLGTLAFVAFVVIVVLILLRTTWGTEKAFAIAKKVALDEKFPGGLHVGRMEGSALSDLELYDVTINGIDGKPMLKAEKITANLKLSALFGKRIELELVRVEGADVVDPRNPVVLPPSDEPFPFRVYFPRVEVRRSRVTLTGEQPITFESLDVDARADIQLAKPLITADVSVSGYWKEQALAFTVKSGARITDKVLVPSLAVTAGDSRIDGTNIEVDLERPVASLQIHATPSVVNKLAPQVALRIPADIQLDVTRAGNESRIGIAATMGSASLFGSLLGDLPAKRARGMLAADGIDIGMYVPALTGTGGGVVGIVGDGTARTANVTAVLHGQLLDLPAGHAVVSADVSEKTAQVVLVAGGAGGLGTAVQGKLVRDANRLELASANVLSKVHDASKVSNRKVPFRGAITVGGSAKGSLAPQLDLRLEGFVSGRRLAATDVKMGGLAIGTVDGTATVRLSEKGTYSKLHGLVKNVAYGGGLVAESVHVDAENRTDGKLAVKLNARPTAVPHMVVDANATIDLGASDADPIVIELGDHTIAAPRLAKWGGSGGKIVIGPETVDIAEVKSSSGRAALSVDAVKIVKATGALDVKANLLRVPMGMVDPAFGGSVSAKVDLKRRGVAWNGTAKLDGSAVTLGPGKPPIEGSALLTLANRRVKADVNASAFGVGAVRFVLDVDGPRDVTDPLAWRKLDRKAVRTALLGITRVDLAALSRFGIDIPTGGIVEGELVLAGMETSGSFRVHDVKTVLGLVEGTLDFAPVGDELGISSSVKVGDLGTADLAAQIVFPAYPFEPNEWKRHGRGIVRVLTLQIEDVLVDSKRLATFGIDTPYSGRVSTQVTLAAGAGEAKVTVDVKNIQGGVLARPVDVAIEATASPKQTTATVRASVASAPLLNASVTLPTYSFDRWLSDPANVVGAPLQGTIELPDLDLVPLLAMIGRQDIKNGRIRGLVTIGGIASKPTATGELVISKVDLKPRLAGRKLPTLEELRITPNWDGTEANIAIKGKESDGATIEITARARPDNLDALLASVILKNFDVAPIAVFLPGPAVAATGKLSANVTVRGLTPDKIRGSLRLEKGRVPVAAAVGTVRDANVDVKLTDAGLLYKMTAKIGAGSVKLEGSAPPDLSKISFRGKVDKFSPIHDIAPLISTDIDGAIFLEAARVRAEAKLTNASVSLNFESGVKLLDADMPDDLFLGRSTPPPAVTKQQRQPREPWVTVKVVLDSTPVYVKHEYFELRARALAPRGVTLSIGRTLGLDGSIDIERGDVDVLGRHYRVDPGPDKIIFDGTTDPELRLRLTHDFPELTLMADISGRASKRDLHMTGIPNTYSQDELLAFFAGGDPGGGAGSTSRDVAANAGAAILSAKLAKTAKKVLPIKVDVIACDAGSATSSQACRFGKWLSENLLVTAKTRPAPRPDEPTSNVEVQYYFKKNWVIEGAGTTDRASGDILWRKRW